MFCLSIYLYVVLSSEGPCILIFISKARKGFGVVYVKIDPSSSLKNLVTCYKVSSGAGSAEQARFMFFSE